jgi:p24 family protein gamma-1
MFHRIVLNLSLVFLCLLIVPLHTFDVELTILIPANQRECFHQQLETGKTIEIEYEVLAGGDMDINYWFYSPTNRVLHTDFKKGDGHQTLKLEETGEYRLCFDNSFSRFSQKQVYFSLRPTYDENQSHDDEGAESWMSDMEKDDLGDLQNKVKELKVGFLALIFCSESNC